MEENQTDATKSAYGKKPLWQWIVIYLVIGGIIYFAAYYFVFANKGYGAPQGTQQTAPQGY